MKTLIVPCGGKSSRFPNMKPKWMLTHPDGGIMVKKAIEGLPLNSFDRIIITVVKQHVKDYDADIILNQLFDFSDELNNYELCVLEDFTKSQSETVYKTIKEKNVQGEIVIKDSDNYVKISAMLESDFIVGIDLYNISKEINRLKSKSYLKVNDQNIVIDIIEKQISSSIVCIGVYGFKSAENFVKTYEKMQNQIGELYVSQIISYMIGVDSILFKYIEAEEYDDWGTMKDWKNVQSNMRTFFVDLDGVIFKNVGKYGKRNWENSMDINQENFKTIKNLYRRGGQIVVTTSRSKKYKELIYDLFHSNGIVLHDVVTDLNHSSRVLINDFAPTNPFPSAYAINVPRNSNIKEYLDFLEIEE